MLLKELKCAACGVDSEFVCCTVALRVSIVCGVENLVCDAESISCDAVNYATGVLVFSWVKRNKVERKFLLYTVPITMKDALKDG